MEILITSSVYLVIIGLLVAYYKRKQRGTLTVEAVEKEYVRRNIHELVVNDRNEKEFEILNARSENAVLKSQLESEMKNVEKEKSRLKEIQEEMLSNFDQLHDQEQLEK